MVIGDPNSPRNLLNFCFSPILDLVNWAQFYNSKQESIYDDTILTVHTGMFHSDVSELKLRNFLMLVTEFRYCRHLLSLSTRRQCKKIVKR